MDVKVSGVSVEAGAWKATHSSALDSLARAADVVAFDTGAKAAYLPLTRIDGECTPTDDVGQAVRLRPRATCGCIREGDD
jgi:hypothetical protein